MITYAEDILINLRNRQRKKHYNDLNKHMKSEKGENCDKQKYVDNHISHDMKFFRCGLFSYDDTTYNMIKIFKGLML